MNEMLGNQHFIAGNYKDAVHVYAQLINTEKFNLEINKKLIISYLKTNQIISALSQFLTILTFTRSKVKCSDSSKEYCVCREMINELNVNSRNKYVGLNRNLVLAILWYFCDLDQSKKYFSRASILAPDDIRLNKINKSLFNN